MTTLSSENPPIVMDAFEFVEVGNTYSEYRHKSCGKTVVVDMEDSRDFVLAVHANACSQAQRQGGENV